MREQRPCRPRKRRARELRLFFLWAPISGYLSSWLLDGNADGASLLFVARWSILTSWTVMLVLAGLEAVRLRRSGGRGGGLAIIACTLASVLFTNLQVQMIVVMLSSLATFD